MINEVISWQSPQQVTDLDLDRIDLWRANLNLSSRAIQELTSCLSQDELARANKFRFVRDKNRFIAARGILRQILTKYLSLNPQQIEFAYSDRGKPRLASSMGNNSLQFNLSHSQDYALYGVTRHCSIGVDLEYLRSMEDAVKIARRFFSPKEYQLIDGLQKAEQLLLFFKLWTAKEAYLKAVGTGLAGSLTSIDLALDEQQQVYIDAIDGNSHTADEWSMYSFIPATNYIAAIAMARPITPEQIHYLSWH